MAQNVMITGAGRSFALGEAKLNIIRLTTNLRQIYDQFTTK